MKLKTKRKNRGIKSGLTSGLTSGLVVIVAITLVLCIHNIGNTEANKVNNNKKFEIHKYLSDENIKNKTDKKKKSGIKLNGITTSKKVFKTLEKECNKKVKKYNNNKYECETEIDTKIAEEAFIDNKENIQTLSKKNTKFKQADKIYMQDKIVIIYTNECGDIKILGAYNSTENNKNKISLPYNIAKKDTKELNIQVLEENELNKMINHFKSNLYLGKYSIKQKLDVDNEIITEEKYIQSLGNEINSIINEGDNKTELINYIENNSETLYKYIKDILINEKIKSVDFITVGKSKTSLEYKDRVIIQLSNKENNKNSEKITIILKLNKQYKIYDIDIM